MQSAGGCQENTGSSFRREWKGEGREHMENMEVIGRWLVILGVVIAVVGGLIWFLSRFFNLAELPGTLRVEGAGITCIFPLLASIVLSIVLTVVLNLVVRWFNR